jgi:hypothetical protein
MSKRITLKKGFRALSLSRMEARSLQWGCVEGFVCNGCNGLIETEELTYIPAFTDTYCEKCAERIIDSIDLEDEEIKREREEDEPYETSLLQSIEEELKLRGFETLTE